MDLEQIRLELFSKDNTVDLISILNPLNSIIKQNVLSTDSITSDLIDLKFLEELKTVITSEDIILFFGKTMRDLKYIYLDEMMREHEVCVKYKGPKKLQISNVNLPHSSSLLDRIYRSIHDTVLAVQEYVNSLKSYFNELENIDKVCTVMEPMNPTFKDEYRRILLDERTWLHVEVTPLGFATNLHLIGQSGVWYDKLQSGLLTWDHDLSIIDNIMKVFELSCFLESSKRSYLPLGYNEPTEELCSICLCSELPDKPGLPQPLCQNSTCGVYFHKSCLFQWLIACAGGRPPSFGVISGDCPSCLQPVSCNEKDN